jgi:hypothetical protein
LWLTSGFVAFASELRLRSSATLCASDGGSASLLRISPNALLVKRFYTRLEAFTGKSEEKTARNLSFSLIDSARLVGLTVQGLGRLGGHENFLTNISLLGMAQLHVNLTHWFTARGLRFHGASQKLNN